MESTQGRRRQRLPGLLAGLLLGVATAGPARGDDLADLEARFRQEKDKPYAIRIETVRSIAALATDEAARFLLGVIEKDEDTSMRLNTIHQVAPMPQRFVFDKLLAYVGSADSGLRSTAFHAIVYNRTEELPAKLVAEILASADQNMRANLLRYFARRSDARFLPEVERFLLDFPANTNSLTSVLVQAGTPGAARILIRLYDDTNRYDREQVSRLFVDAEPGVRATLPEALGSAHAAVVAHAAQLCARAKVTEAEAAIVAACSAKDPLLRATLIESLGAIGASSEGARQVLLSALEPGEVAVQVAAARAARGAPFGAVMLPLIDLLAGTKDRLLAAETSVTLEQVTGQQYGARADLWRAWWQGEAATFDFAAVKPPSADRVPQSLVDLAIERGAAALKRTRAEKTPWTYANHAQGTTALVLLALQAAGFDRKDRDVKAGLAWLAKAPVPETTYDTGLVAMALEALEGKRQKRRIAECARRLLATQKDRGLWGYPTGDGDNSNTQYAVLGLRAAARVGVKIPSRAWTRIRDHFLSVRGNDGGWAYPIENRSYSSTSMTASGVCCLLLCLENLALDEGERTILDHAIEDGYTALGTLMKLDKDTLYALYGIERAGVLGSRATMAGNPWYAPGARRLVAEQGRDGFWTGSYSEAVETAFAILFLKRATVPVASAAVTGR